MSTGLEEEWQKIQLTEDEEKVVLVDDKEESEKNDQIELCLLGKLYTGNSFNSMAMKLVFQNIWKPTKGVVIRDFDARKHSPLAIFSALSAAGTNLNAAVDRACAVVVVLAFGADRDYVLNEGPWAFDGHILLLKQTTCMEILSDVQFSTGRFWVKAYDVPSKKQTYSFARLLASNIGTLVSCDESTMFGIDKALCFRVDIDITKPLRHGMNVNIGADDDDPNLQYGIRLRAFPLKIRKCSAEAELAKEKHLCWASQGRKSKPKAQTRLVFNNPAPIGSKSGSALETSASPLAMITNVATVVVPSGDVFKRKQIDPRLS
ncbi:hypothetical protein Cgig2_015165 [Carnegiea gigantea]|uniref:DUF4283 domain-containing protein n=1 Tax=Carnegiea gigantea TaxID=171969 RepID=A0A9Q1KR02_9CARY|nr:hypothetical protein Cgig2_015165 [Carnegiea gigantea]